MSTPSPLHADTERIRAWVAAHRHIQAEQRNALAAESRRALRGAEHRSHLLINTLRRSGAAELAAQLLNEADAGTVLIVALTSDDADDAEVGQALNGYLHHRGIIDAAIAATTG